MAITPDEHFARLEAQQRRDERAADGAGEAARAAVETDGVTPDAVRDLLREVIDPELGVDIVSLGLVRDVTIADGVVDVAFTVTTPACPLSSYIADEIRSTLDWLPGIDRVEARLGFEPPWEPEHMDDNARAALGWGS